MKQIITKKEIAEVKMPLKKYAAYIHPIENISKIVEKDIVSTYDFSHILIILLQNSFGRFYLLGTEGTYSSLRVRLERIPNDFNLKISIIKELRCKSLFYLNVINTTQMWLCEYLWELTEMEAAQILLLLEN